MAKEEKVVLKWRCDACGEAENISGVGCTLWVYSGEPVNCPLTGEDNEEWYPVKKRL